MSHVKNVLWELGAFVASEVNVAECWQGTQRRRDVVQMVVAQIKLRDEEEEPMQCMRK